MTRAQSFFGMLAFTLVSLEAMAVEPVALPPFIERHIAKTVAEADVVALVTVASTHGEASQMRVRFEVDRLMMGDAPQELDLPGQSFFEGDLAAGTQLLVPLKRMQAASGRQVLVPTHRYELLSNGHIREYPAEGYLAAMVPHIDAKRAKQTSEASEEKVRARQGPSRSAAKGAEPVAPSSGMLASARPE